jgi:alpha-glucosidase (family GH31 glycosyl hydrolase)
MQSGRVHTIPAPLSTLPLFARSGASIPVAGGVAGRHLHDDPVSATRSFGP